MHDNVDIARELQETKLLFDSVLLTQGKASGGADASADEKLLETAKSVYDKVKFLIYKSFFRILVAAKSVLFSCHQSLTLKKPETNIRCPMGKA